MRRKNYEMGRIKISGVENLATLSVLSEERERDLLKKVCRGEKEVKDEIIYGRLNWVAGIVQHCFGERDDLEDLFQLGCIGLIKAVERYDFRYGVAFTTYADALIVGEIRNYLYANDIVRIPVNIKRLGCRVAQAVQFLTASLQRSPTTSEISLYTKLSEKDVTEVLRSFQKPVDRKSVV